MKTKKTEKKTVEWNNKNHSRYNKVNKKVSKENPN